MVVSHRHRYLFVEVPATASTAISKELREQYEGELVLYKHANYSEFEHQASRAERRYFAFAGVRNPLDVTVSHYLRLKADRKGVYSDPSQYERNGGWIPDTHVERFEFIRKNNADFPTFFRRFYRSVFFEWVLLRSSRFDFIIRFENLQAAFAEALKRIGIEAVRPLPVVNERGTERGDVLDYYTAEIRPLAARVFGPFMRRWGYQFPSNWTNARVPVASELQFRTVTASANLAAKLFPLSPRNARLQRIKDALTGS